MALQLPLGFKFQPTDKQLVVDYLQPKLQGKLSWNVIKEKEIYGPNANPWEIFDDSSTRWIMSGTQKSVYVFTRLAKIADKASCGDGNEHYVRKAGCGTWHVETGRTDIMDGDGKPVGEKRMLVFQINDVKGLRDGSSHYWKMHEFFVKGVEDYVVCRITCDVSKVAKVSASDGSGTRGSGKRSKGKKTGGTKSKESVCDSGKEVASIHDSSVVIDGNYVVGGGDGTNTEMMTYHNPLAPMNQGTHGEVDPELEDLFGGDFWLNVDTLLMDEPMSNNDVSLNFEDLFDAAGSWSDKNMEELGQQVSNNVQGQQQQQQQQATRMNMSCMLGKRQSFEAQEARPIKKSRI